MKKLNIEVIVEYAIVFAMLVVLAAITVFTASG
jgi:hypothetical protein